MNILICTSQVPFVSGGAELHVENLRRALIEAGHDADVVSLPFKWYPPREIIRSTLAWRMLDVTEANGKPVDMVIGMKFPAYLVEHPRKVLWIIHQYRSAYDLAGTPYDDLCYYGDGVQTRMFVKNADEKFIPRALKVYANSQNVAARLRRFNNIKSEALCYLPWDEDYGYVSLEARYAGKPLIVARDGGGATEFIEDGREGLLVDPTPQDVARAIDELYFDRKRAGETGARAREKVLAMN